MMKRQYWIALLLGMLCLAPALADDDDDDDDDDRRRHYRYGTIYSVEPRYIRIDEPRERCRTEWVNETREVAGSRNYTGMVVGGIAGGAIGAQIGEGRQQDVATVAGAVAGAVIGDKVMERHQRPRTEVVPRQVRVCEQVRPARKKLKGYDVAYRVRGREYTTFTREYPGRVGARFPVRYRDDD